MFLFFKSFPDLKFYSLLSSVGPLLCCPPWIDVLAPKVSFYACFTEDFKNSDHRKAYPETPQVSFHTYFAEDFGNSDFQKQSFQTPRV